MEVVIDEAEDEGGLLYTSLTFNRSVWGMVEAAAYFADGGLAEQNELDAAARLRRGGCRVGHWGGGGRGRRRIG